MELQPETNLEAGSNSAAQFLADALDGVAVAVLIDHVLAAALQCSQHWPLRV
jgi:hypothetical protein